MSSALIELDLYDLATLTQSTPTENCSFSIQTEVVQLKSPPYLNQAKNPVYVEVYLLVTAGSWFKKSIANQDRQLFKKISLYLFKPIVFFSLDDASSQLFFQSAGSGIFHAFVPEVAIEASQENLTLKSGTINPKHLRGCYVANAAHLDYVVNPEFEAIEIQL